MSHRGGCCVYTQWWWPSPLGGRAWPLSELSAQALYTAHGTHTHTHTLCICMCTCMCTDLCTCVHKCVHSNMLAEGVLVPGACSTIVVGVVLCVLAQMTNRLRAGCGFACRRMLHAYLRLVTAVHPDLGEVRLICKEALVSGWAEGMGSGWGVEVKWIRFDWTGLGWGGVGWSK